MWEGMRQLRGVKWRLQRNFGGDSERVFKALSAKRFGEVYSYMLSIFGCEGCIITLKEISGPCSDLYGVTFPPLETFTCTVLATHLKHLRK